MKISKEVIDRWLQFYSETHKRGLFINECIKNKIMHRDSDRCLDLEEGLNMTLMECRKFLDKNRIFPAAPKWKYNKDDKRTWASHPSFTYKHLM